MIIGATTTWNNADMVEICLRHYRKLGMDQLLVMDFDSNDGTADVLDATPWSGFVRRIPFPGIEQLDSSNLLLDLVRKEYPPGTLVLFFDPDELLVTPSMTMGEITRLHSTDGWGGCVIPRFNMTATRVTALTFQDRMDPLGGLNLQIVRRSARRALEEIHHDVLDPPWIWSAIPGKVLVTPSRTVKIGDGDHVATMCDGSLGDAGEGIYLLHYPFRTWREFEEKIEMAKIDMGVNAEHLPDTYGWQIKRWIRLSGMGRLHEEYLSQFIPEDSLHNMLDTAAVVRNDRIREFHGHFD